MISGTLAGGRAAHALRDAAWLTAARARAYCRILAVVSLTAIIAVVVRSRGGLDPFGKPLGTDFISFYSAARLAAQAGGSAAYDMARHAAMETAQFPAAQYGYTTFLYPPTFLLMCLPLALLPYVGSLVAWLAAGLALLAVAMRRLLGAIGLLPLLCYPAVLINAGHGQNACFTAAAFAGFMVLGDRRPLLGGACLGALVIKPQLALLVPVVLIAGGRWRALLGAAVCAAALAGAATLAFGPAIWADFAAAAPAGRAMLFAGGNGFAKMPSPFAGFRLLGLDNTLSLALQALVSLAVAAVAAWEAARRQMAFRQVACRQGPPRQGAAADGAMMAAGALLVSPWCFDYDLVLLAPALAWVLARGVAAGFLPWEKTALLAAYLLPLLVRGMASGVGLPLGPPVLAALFLIVFRRAAPA